MCTAMLFDPEDEKKHLEEKLKELEEKKRELELQISKVSRKATLLDRLEEKLKDSAKISIPVTALVARILQS